LQTSICAVFRANIIALCADLCSTERVRSVSFDEKRWRRTWVFFAMIAAVLGIATLYVAGVLGRSSGLSALEAQARTDASLKVALLRAVLERPRALPLLLAVDRDVEEAIAQPRTRSATILNAKLEDLVSQTNAAVIYVIDAKGVAISASNWREPTSFVGNDYRFREYFSKAVSEGRAEHFALGTVSNRPGLYISQRIGTREQPLGVVVVKMEFDQLEDDWRETRRPSFVTDSRRVVLITSIPSWRFMTTGTLTPGQVSTIRESLQFGDAPLSPLPLIDREKIASDATLTVAQLPTGRAEYLQISVPVPTTDWQFQYLVPSQAALSAAAREYRFVALSILMGLLLMSAIGIRRRQASLSAIVREQAQREELETRVIERTRALSLARDRLQAEIFDHRSTDAKLQIVQQDLVQANRLAILGQVAAGVAHEINQPVATIRAYADNSKVFIERNQIGSAVENLDLIAGLTERIGLITDNLKALARRGRKEAEPVVLLDAMEAAVMLLKSRFTGRIDRLSFTAIPKDLEVMGSRLRLEQVFINLFQNALEAVEAEQEGKVVVSVQVSDTDVAVGVEDNGPGIPDDILKALFQPFNSSKDNGLGLGLVISKDIVEDFGGEIRAKSSATGTRFIIHLKRPS
jgi:two-component system C4-dicarboxylate transport sensor histidine kinase DctB